MPVMALSTAEGYLRGTHGYREDTPCLRWRRRRRTGTYGILTGTVRIRRACDGAVDGGRVLHAQPCREHPAVRAAERDHRTCESPAVRRCGGAQSVSVRAAPHATDSAWLRARVVVARIIVIMLRASVVVARIIVIMLRERVVVERIIVIMLRALLSDASTSRLSA